MVRKIHQLIINTDIISVTSVMRNASDSIKVEEGNFWNEKSFVFIYGKYQSDKYV